MEKVIRIDESKLSLIFAEPNGNRCIFGQAANVQPEECYGDFLSRLDKIMPLHERSIIHDANKEMSYRKNIAENKALVIETFARHGHKLEFYSSALDTTVPAV